MPRDTMMFCVLEKDPKTYEYFRRCAQHILVNDADNLARLDAELQSREIMTHLEVNGIPQANTDEKIRWIQDHSKGFRAYLNTIKFAAMVWCTTNQREPIWDEFCAVADQIASKKACLDNIHA